jgi:hypothetical protein
MPGFNAAGTEHHPDFAGIIFVQLHGPDHEISDCTLSKNTRRGCGTNCRDKTHEHQL